MSRRIFDRARVPIVKRAVPFLLLVVLAAEASAARRQDETFWTKPQAEVRVEFGIDSLERKFYRPEFAFSWPWTVGGGRGRTFLGVSYLQRINGKLQGVVDYWIEGGAEKRLGRGWSFEAGLRHFCRHLTSIANPYVLNLNELVGGVRWRGGDMELAAAVGPFIGGSRGFDEVAVFDFTLARLLLPELSFESRFKWVNFRRIYYEASLAVALNKGAVVFLRAARDYDLPTAAYIGLRLRPDGAFGRALDGFHLTAGAYPFYGRHKLMVQGSYRLELFREEKRRLFFDAEFRSPLLSGDGFFAQFWPDRMLYAVSGEYERRLPDGLRAAWYARYFVDMPVDKAIRFRSSLATGLLVRNQDDFNRLDKPVRFEIAAGYDFTFDFDVRFKAGVTLRPPGAPLLGVEFQLEANGERETDEFRLFASLGRTVEARPFIGVRNITYSAGGPPPPNPFSEKLIAGIAFYTWF